jgi:hypothetical protein
MAYAIKAEIIDPRARRFTFTAHKTMYGGKLIAQGDTIFVFASENEGGKGLIARGIVTHAEATRKEARRATPNAARERHHQTNGACDAANGTPRTQASHRLERRPAWDRTQFQILSASNQQNRRYLR